MNTTAQEAPSSADSLKSATSSPRPATDLGLAIDTIHQGDCVELLAQLPDESVDLAFADPPYNIGFKYDQYDDRQEDEVYLGWCESWIEQLHRVVKPTGAFWLAIGDEYAAELKVAAKRIGFTTRNWVVWYYTFGQNCRRKFNRSHAHLFHFIKDEDLHTFNAADPAIRVPSARALVYGDRRANATGRLPDDTWIIPPAENGESGMGNGERSASDPQASRERVIPQSAIHNPQSFTLRPQDLRDEESAFHPQDDTWYFSRVAGTFKERQGFHGCQMPEQLLGRIVRASSNDGDLVLDPFSGSGTTLAVAKKLGRHWLGCELSTDYVKYATERIEKIEPGEPLSGPADPVRSSPTTAAGRKLKGHPMVAADAAKAEGGGRKAESSASDTQAPRERVIPQSEIRNPQSPTPSLRDLTRQALSDAFHTAAPGASLDWLLCRPDLQAAFHSACEEAGLLGGPYEWNRQLLKLRKSGALGKDAKKAPKKKGSAKAHPSVADGCPYAAEIAWAKVRAKHAGASLDDILCDPGKAELFDREAKRVAPGGEAYEHRWEALRLRKAAKTHKSEAKQYDYVVAKLVKGAAASRLKKLTLRTAKPVTGGGVYLLTTDKKPSEGMKGYVGATDDLDQTLGEHLVRPPLRGDLYFLAISDSELPSAEYRDALRWNLVHALRPVLSIDLLSRDSTL